MSAAALGALARVAEPLALGLSTGTWCAMYCAPVLLPFLCGRESMTHRTNLSLVGLFLGGRLVAYVGIGFALGAAGLLASEFFDPVLARRLSTIAYMVCGAALLVSAFGPRCLKRLSCGAEKKDAQRPCVNSRLVSLLSGDRATAVVAGLGVGLHICPPFWAAAARSASAANPGAGAFYFALFYAGTLPFFLPLLGLPFFAPRLPTFRRVARIAQALVGGYFLCIAGLLAFLFGSA